MGGGEHGRGEVDGDVQHVEADQSVLHQAPMEGGRVAAFELVQQAHALVGRAQQGAGAAGEIPDLKGADASRVAPVRPAGRPLGGHGDAG